VSHILLILIVVRKLSIYLIVVYIITMLFKLLRGQGHFFWIQVSLPTFYITRFRYLPVFFNRSSLSHFLLHLQWWNFNQLLVAIVLCTLLVKLFQSTIHVWPLKGNIEQNLAICISKVLLVNLLPRISNLIKKLVFLIKGQRLQIVQLLLETHLRFLQQLRRVWF
jgi:hypothetical protein